MHVDILTLFPGLFRGWLDETIIARAIGEGLLEIDITNIRDFATDRHHTVDDYPYGGGAGMVMKPDVIFAAAESVMARHPGELGPVVLLTPQGRLFSQDIAREMARERRLMLICGRYEGVDERVREHLATEEISIGDYVLSGGELAAMVVIDAVAREVPGVLGSEASRLEESHAAGLLEYPQYTRPPEYRGWKVPEVLLSGNHGAIARWRRQQSLLRTKARRPDLLAKASLIEEDRRLLEEAEEG